MFIALSITDLKLYFFLGETAKREKGGRRGEITDTADTSKHGEGDAAEASGAHTDSRAAKCAVGLHGEVATSRL